MIDLREWLAGRPDAALVPLFETNAQRVVTIKRRGSGGTPILKRSSAMETAIIELVEDGLPRSDWQGVLYVMGWGQEQDFEALYVGKAEKKGRQNGISVNLTNLRRDRGKFARWGDGRAYHIGDLSHAVFNQAEGSETKYARWAKTLFESREPPQLRRDVSLYLLPWRDGSPGPSGFVGSLPAVEKEVIALAAVQFGESLLNVDGR